MLLPELYVKSVYLEFIGVERGVKFMNILRTSYSYKNLGTSALGLYSEDRTLSGLSGLYR
jgi:hypothetical protein